MGWWVAGLSGNIDHLNPIEVEVEVGLGLSLAKIPLTSTRKVSELLVRAYNIQENNNIAIARLLLFRYRYNIVNNDIF